jgi:hypothetical protein
MSSNLESVIYLTFQLNISRVEHRLLKNEFEPTCELLGKMIV